ncbi:hypothetical protein Cylst_6133 [Cylindrospermum stagnale PCC 7417]|uniref:Uncharacterized protein n=1 Tax=Cylindrospermum stagnale PCC 7417 TaxID=56107 RepID=K9X7Q9_9NOST|nr:hypothetical protein [Cylindrospermum stagnale]AFZ28101.1 hypothetical protein Cylst_6133 [Cylindrospermum stagnale PCC 7417]
MELVKRYKRFLWLLIALGICTIIGILSGTLGQSVPIEKPPISNKKCPQVKLWQIAFLKWDDLIKLEVEEWQPSVSGAFNYNAYPGPKKMPVRPFLNPFVSPGGIAGSLETASQTTSVVVRLGKNPKLIQLPNPPLSLGTRKDGGLWVDSKGTTGLYNADGKQVRTIKTISTNFISVEQDAIWLISADKKAQFVDADGNVKGPYPWDGLNNYSGHGQSLCQLKSANPARIKCLEPDGKQRFFSLSLSEPPGGQILQWTNQKLWTVSGRDLIIYQDLITGVKSKLEIANAGITTTGDVFVSVKTNDQWTEVCISDGSSRWVPISYGFSPIAGMNLSGRLYVMAIDKQRTLVYNYDLALWYKGDKIEERFVVDENNFRNRIFPHAWIFNPNSHLENAKSSDGTVVLSASGPTGIVLIGLRWNP